MWMRGMGETVALLNRIPRKMPQTILKQVRDYTKSAV